MRALWAVSAILVLGAGNILCAQMPSYKNAEAQMKFYYPAELSMEDPHAMPRRSYRSIYAMHPDQDPEHVGADPCSPLRFMIGTGPDHHLPASKDDAFEPLAPTGGISLVEVNRKCLNGQSEEDFLEKTVNDLQSMTGMYSTAATITYDLDRHPVTLSTVHAFSRVDNDVERKKSNGITFVAVAALTSQGHLFIWTFVANDLTLFNTMLQCEIQFGEGRVRRLTPFIVTTANPQNAVPGASKVDPELHLVPVPVPQ
jgi:hypothetical protein